MVGRISMSQAPLDSEDFSDGQIHPLIAGSELWLAITTETWLNCSEATRQRILQAMLVPHNFVGTIISSSRRQVELTVVIKDPETKQSLDMHQLCLTLANFHRFL